MEHNRPRRPRAAAGSLAGGTVPRRFCKCEFRALAAEGPVFAAGVREAALLAAAPPPRIRPGPRGKEGKPLKAEATAPGPAARWPEQGKK